MSSFARSAGMMLLLLCAICSAFCCSWCVLTGVADLAPNGPTRHFKRGKFALGFTNVALLGAFATGAIGIVQSDVRMAYASAGFLASSLLVPWLVVDRSVLIFVEGDGITRSVPVSRRTRKMRERRAMD